MEKEPSYTTGDRIEIRLPKTEGMWAAEVERHNVVSILDFSVLESAPEAKERQFLALKAIWKEDGPNLFT